MKKIVSLALALVLVLSLTACGGKDGGKSADPNLGKYIGTEFSSDGDSWYSLADLYDGECYIELKSDGKGVFCLGGEATDIKWSLESDGSLTLKRDGLESNGLLQDGCIMLDDLWGNEVYTLYEKEDADSSPEKTGDTLLDWWNGDWYGWWKMTGCYGGYESMDGTSMASPHAAGGMAIVQQALKARDNSMTGAQRKHMTDTLLMSTAHVIYDDNGVPYSPRKQGAGLMSINDAVNTRGYLSVAGMERPKLELKDDPAMKGVYTMTFTVHNTGSDTLYYDVTPLVLTDTTEAYVNGGGQEFSTISGSSRLLPHTFTTNCENNRVSVAPGKTADVTVTVTVTDEGRKMLAQFPNGSYVEGFVTLTQVAADGSSLTDPIDLGVPFLAF